MTNWWNEVTQTAPAQKTEPSIDWWGEVSKPQDNQLLEKAKRGEVPSIGQGKADFMANPTANISPVDSSDNMASITTQATASLPNDIKERAQYFAKQRFPNDPNAIARYGVQDGRLFYEGEDGKFYFEEPAAKFGQMSKYFASGVGPALPFAGSVAGAVATSPLGGVPGAAAGAAGGDLARQSLAQGLGMQEGYKPLQTVGETALGAGGQALGIVGGKAINKTFGWNPAKDLSKIQTPEAKAAIKELEEKAAEYGYTLTAAEKTNLQSLIDKENTLGSLPASGNIMREFYQTRTENQAPAAVNKVLEKISATQSPEVGASNFQTGAKDVISFEEKALKDRAKPLYTDAFYIKNAEGQLIPKTIKQKDSSGGYGINGYGNTIVSKVTPNSEKIGIDVISGEPITKELPSSVKTESVNGRYGAMSSIEKLSNNSTYSKFAAEANTDPILQGAPQESFVHLDKTRSLMLTEMRALEAQGKKNSTPWRRLNSAQKYVDSVIQNNLDPEGKAALEEARGLYTEGAPLITSLTKGEIGLAANKKPTQVLSAPASVFKSGKDSIAKNREAFIKAGQEKEWNDGLRSYLQTTFDNVSMKGLTPEAKYRDAIFQKGGRERIKAAMSRDQWINFNRFMDVMEAVGRVPKGGSRTAFAGEGIADMKKEAGGLVSKTLRAVNPTNIANTGRIANAYDDFMLGRHSAELAEITTSPENMKKLKTLRGISPRSKKAINVTSQVLSQYGIGSVAKPNDVPRGGFSDKNGNQQ